MLIFAIGGLLVREWRAAIVLCGVGLADCGGSFGLYDSGPQVCATPRQPAPVVSSTTYDGVSVEALKTMVRHEDGTVDLAAGRVLGERYDKGQDVPADIRQALVWYRFAATVRANTTFVYGGSPGTLLPVTGSSTPGDPVAIHRLGELYLDGIGVEADFDRGEWLLACAAAYGVIYPKQSDELKRHRKDWKPVYVIEKLYDAYN